MIPSDEPFSLWSRTGENQVPCTGPKLIALGALEL